MVFSHAIFAVELKSSKRMSDKHFLGPGATTHRPLAYKIQRICLLPFKAARARGRKGGRPKKLGQKELKTIRALLRSNEVPVKDIATQFGVNRSTLYRNMMSAA
jgi:transcriptional regulator of acetoin/glycerol metabolism